MTQVIREMETGTHISRDGVYRYLLWRVWDSTTPYLNVIGLNPSTADATTNDHTITTCIRFARDWGFGGLRMTNLYALRSTDPAELRRVVDPIGPENDQWIYQTATQAARTLVAWGGHTMVAKREVVVLKLLEHLPLACLGLLKGGGPHHPLYLRSDTKPIPYHTPEFGNLWRGSTWTQNTELVSGNS